jgi:hypothetical protein
MKKKYGYLKRLSAAANVNLGDAYNIVNHAEDLVKTALKQDYSNNLAYLDMILSFLVSYAKEGKLGEIEKVLSENFKEYFRDHFTNE